MLYGLIIGIVGITAAVHFCGILLLLLRSRTVALNTVGRPPVTIVRPCCGIENAIEETLSSGFALDYPDYEIVFCVAERDDPVVPVIERLILEHPAVPARLLFGNDRISINPKLNNLAKGVHAAAHEWLVMTDSNVLMPADYLDRLLERWSPGTGAVSTPPVGIRPFGLSAELECAFLNTYQARWLLLSDALGTAFAQGKSILWRREDLERAGGVAALALEPAEDAAFTKLVRAAGRRVRIVFRPFEQPLGARPLRDVLQRQLRWARLRRRSFVLPYLLELIGGGVLPLAATGVLVDAGVVPIGGLVGLAIAWYGAEVLLARGYGWPASIRITALMVVRDLLLVPFWIAGWTGDGFTWRGHAMSMTAAGGSAQNRIGRWRSSRTSRFAMMRATGKRPAASAEQGDRTEEIHRG